MSDAQDRQDKRQEAMEWVGKAYQLHMKGEIDQALERLSDGTYGVCRTCGSPIAAGRLAARPAATECITCAARRPPH